MNSLYDVNGKPGLPHFSETCFPRGAVKQTLLSLAPIVTAFAFCGNALAVDVRYDRPTHGGSARSPYFSGGGSNLESSPSTMPVGMTTTTSSSSYYIHDNTLYRAVADWISVSNGNGQTEWRNNGYRWIATSWNASDNNVNIINGGSATGTGGAGITGSNNTVNLSGNGTIGGTAAGVLNLYTNDASGNTLNIGYYNGNPATGGGISANGVANVGHGTINIHDGQVTGTITASGSGATNVAQSGGSVNGAGGNGIHVAGANSAYDMTGGAITNQARVEFTGGGASFFLHDGAGSGGVIDGGANVSMTNGGNLFAQYGGTGGVLTGNASVMLGRNDSAAADSIQGGNEYRLYGNARIGDAGDLTSAPSVTMSGGNALFDQYGDSRIGGASSIAIHRGNSAYDSAYLQHGNSSIGDSATVTLTGGGNSYGLYENASINGNAAITLSGGNNAYRQYGDSKIGGGAAISLQDGGNLYQQYDNSEITGNATVGLAGGNNAYQQYGDSRINGNAAVTLQDGGNLYQQYDNSEITGSATVGLSGGNNTYRQYGDSRIGGGAAVTLQGGGSLYRQYGGSSITDDATINLTGGGDNRFHMFQNSSIMGNAVINMNETGSTGNYFLMDDHDPAASGESPKIGSSGSGGDAINMNGANTRLNVFTQLHGRVSTAGAGSQPDGARINLNGDGSRQNIFELDGDASFNDYHVRIGSDTSAQGIYHQQGGRKNGSITITGGQNLFWLNDNADYHARTAIRSGTGDDSGNNLAVIDFSGVATGQGYHSRPDALSAGPADTVHASTPGFAADAALDLSGTTRGGNNLFLANGDVYGAITGGGGDSETHVYVGFIQEKTHDPAVPGSNGYSWYRNDSAEYNPTGLGGGLVPGANADVDAGQEIGPYFDLSTQVNDTDHLNVRKIEGGGGALRVQVTAGNLYNLKAHAAASPDTEIAASPGLAAQFPVMYPAGYPDDPNRDVLYHSGPTAGDLDPGYAALRYTVDFSNHGDYQVYALLNQDAVNIGAYVDQDRLSLSPARVTVGAIKDIGADGTGYDNRYGAIDLGSGLSMPGVPDGHTVDHYENAANYGPHEYADFFDGRQAQITAGMVNVFAGSKLTVHPNFAEMGGAGLANDAVNVIDNLNVIGRPADSASCAGCGHSPFDPAAWAVVTLDRATLHARNEGTAVVHGSAGDGYSHFAPYTANVIVGGNGILQGFGEITGDGDHTPLRPNLAGDLAVLAGGTIRPYDGYQGERQVFDYANKTWRALPAGGLFVFHGNALDAYRADSAHPDYVDNSGGAFDLNASQLKGLIMRVDGVTTFERASRFSSRLFAERDGGSAPIGLTLRVPGEQTFQVVRNLGDSLESSAFDFGEIAYGSIYLKNGVNNPFTPDELAAGGKDGAPIASIYHSGVGDKIVWTGVAQRDKVQYTPVFGFGNELKTKLDYEIYRGDPRLQDGGTTYHYQVAYGTGGNAVDALKDMPDANHLFNRDILFSDMLGNWSFEKQAGDEGVVLRYRQLAAHPQDGGIARDIPERSAVEAAKKLDEIRYPFLTRYNTADPTLDSSLFRKDPSLDGAGVETPYDPVSTNPWEYGHYDGNPYDAAGFDGDIKAYYYLNQERFPNYREDRVEDIENYFRALQLEATSAADINRAVRLITAEPYATMTSANLATMNAFIAGRERNAGPAALHGGRRAAGSGQRMSAVLEPGPADASGDSPRFWTAALGGRSRQHRAGDEYGYTTRSGGIQVGVVKEIDDLYLGLTGGYVHAVDRWSELRARNRSDNYLGEALIGLRHGPAFFELSVNAGRAEQKMTRRLRLGRSLNGGSPDPALDANPFDNYHNGIYDVTQTGDYSALLLGGGVRAGYQQSVGDGWRLLSTIGVRYQQSRNLRKFTEDGPDDAAFRLSFRKGDIKRNSVRVPLMLRLNRDIAFSEGSPWVFTPEIRIGATANLYNRGGKARYQWIGNPIPDRAMKSWGVQEKHVSWQLGGTLEVSRRGRFYMAVDYDLDYAKGKRSHGFLLQAGLNF
ncbi:MAG: hypothetical protein LBI87_05510 [Candidatus Accumulibacter sp.]|jgi:hypothetical protein|nr:hypothetical protein [Accumulibacter sp.]